MQTPEKRRERAMVLLRTGKATVTEAARLASLSRQRLEYWVRRLGIDPQASREKYLRQRWEKTQ